MDLPSILVSLLILHAVDSSMVCSRGSIAFIRTTNVRPPVRVIKELRPLYLASSSCHHLCYRQENCSGYLIDVRNNSCLLVTSLYSVMIRQNDLETKQGWNYHRKLCLSPNAVCSRDWIFEEIASSQLVGLDQKAIHDVHSAEQCIESCATEKSFTCRSARYDTIKRICTLSRQSQRTAPEAFKKASPQTLYLENRCADELAAFASSPTIEKPINGNKHRLNDTFREYYLKESTVGGGSGIDCQDSFTRFELVSGFFLSSTPYKTTRDFVPQECLKLCRQEKACKSVNIDYKRSVCEFMDQATQGGGSGGATTDRNLKENAYFNYFEKVCLKTSSPCSRDWAFERMPAREMTSVSSGKISVDVSSREDCEIACLEFKPFVCRSAEYNHQTRKCKLSPYNRFSMTEKHPKLDSSKFNVDYLENNCANEAKGFCNWKVSKQQRLVLAHKFTITEDADRCESECLNCTDFVCRSFTYESGTKTCALSHHSRRTAPPPTIVRNPSSTLYELSTCFDVTVECEPDTMRAKVLSNTIFQGKAYARDRPASCSVDVGNSMEFSLSITLTGDECGTITEEEGKFSNVLVIQSNDHVVTAFDKAIGVKCGFDVGNKTGEIALQVNELKLTDRSRASPQLPDLSLHITDMTGYEREVVNLGELLKVQVRMSDEDTYGIFIRNLIAKDETGYNNLTLIDQSGCPVEAKMMREVRTVDQKSKSLESFFEAFSFTGSSTLELETEVETCLDKCRPVQCHLVTGRSDDDYETVQSFGRRKREASDKPQKGDVLETTRLTKTLSIKAQQFGIGPNRHKAKPITAPPTKVPNSSMMDKLHAHDLGNGSRSLMPKSSFKYVVDDLGYYCFEPSALATFSGATLLIQGLFFTIALVMATRMKKDKSLTESTLNIY